MSLPSGCWVCASINESVILFIAIFAWALPFFGGVAYAFVRAVKPARTLVYIISFGPAFLAVVYSVFANGIYRDGASFAEIWQERQNRKVEDTFD